jgi:hypothetical protein
MMGLAMVPTFLRVFLLAERRRGLQKRRERLLTLFLGRPTAIPLQPLKHSAQIYTFMPRSRARPAPRRPRALP